jgi:hypothetical protein
MLSAHSPLVLSLAPSLSLSHLSLSLLGAAFRWGEGEVGRCKVLGVSGLKKRWKKTKKNLAGSECIMLILWRGGAIAPPKTQKTK